MVKPEKSGHLHLVYHFTVPLIKQNAWSKKKLTNTPSIFDCVLELFQVTVTSWIPSNTYIKESALQSHY